MFLRPGENFWLQHWWQVSRQINRWDQLNILDFWRTSPPCRQETCNHMPCMLNFFICKHLNWKNSFKPWSYRHQLYKAKSAIHADAQHKIFLCNVNQTTQSYWVEYFIQPIVQQLPASDLIVPTTPYIVDTFREFVETSSPVAVNEILDSWTTNNNTSTIQCSPLFLMSMVHRAWDDT